MEHTKGLKRDKRWDAGGRGREFAAGHCIGVGFSPGYNGKLCEVPTRGLIRADRCFEEMALEDGGERVVREQVGRDRPARHRAGFQKRDGGGLGGRR